MGSFLALNRSSSVTVTMVTTVTPGYQDSVSCQVNRPGRWKQEVPGARAGGAPYSLPVQSIALCHISHEGKWSADSVYPQDCCK